MTKEIEKNESNNILFPFTINKDIDTWLPQDQRISFQKSFAYLRKKLQIKQSRKTYIDSILKKCKARFFRAINDCMKRCLKIHITKFPQSFITNISIESNKLIIGLTVQEVYQQFNLSNINLGECCFEENLCYKGKENYFSIPKVNKSRHNTNSFKKNNFYSYQAQAPHRNISALNQKKKVKNLI